MARLWGWRHGRGAAMSNTIITIESMDTPTANGYIHGDSVGTCVPYAYPAYLGAFGLMLRVPYLLKKPGPFMPVISGACECFYK